LVDLLGTIEHLEDAGTDLYLDQQSIDTTSPMVGFTTALMTLGSRAVF
jgi:hypothetical protein